MVSSVSDITTTVTVSQLLRSGVKFSRCVKSGPDPFHRRMFSRNGCVRYIQTTEDTDTHTHTHTHTHKHTLTHTYKHTCTYIQIHTVTNNNAPFPSYIQ